jgi:hypothetical protein
MWWNLAAAGMGSLTALAIAFIAYPWQKNRDRSLAVQTEKRAIYAEFIRTFSSLSKESWRSMPTPHYYDHKIRDMFPVLHLYAPLNVIEACYQAFEAREPVVKFLSGDKEERLEVHHLDFSE